MVVDGFCVARRLHRYSAWSEVNCPERGVCKNGTVPTVERNPFPNANKESSSFKSAVLMHSIQQKQWISLPFGPPLFVTEM